MPWAELTIDRKPVGTTPLRDIELDVGNHSLHLRCPPLGREVDVPIVIRKAGSTRVVVDLQSDPPGIRISP